MRHRPAALMLTGLLALGLVACSGGGSDEGITKSEFLAKATKVCNATRKEIDAAAEQMDPTDPQALSKFVVQASTEILDEIQTLRDIGFPAGDDGLLDKAFGVYEDRFAKWQDDPSAAATGASDKELIAAGKVLESYGLPACGADLGKGKGKGD
ncbi:MAG: hypothetical protein U0P45_10810 [Acidimicrobiales bacterium]